MLKILTGDCLAILPTLPAQSVQCCVTWEGGSFGEVAERFTLTLIVAFLTLTAHAFVTVQQYGAKGDGSTDDTSAFQAALNSGQEVHVLPANYAIRGTITFPAGSTIVGENNPTLLVGPQQAFVLNSYGAYVNISGLTINGQNQGGNIFCFESSGNIYIHNCLIENAHQAFLQVSGACDNTKLYDCFISNMTGCAFNFSLGTGGGIWIKGCEVISNNNSPSMYFWGIGGITIDDYNEWYNGTSPKLGGFSVEFFSCYDLVVNNAVLDGLSSGGFYFQACNDFNGTGDKAVGNATNGFDFINCWNGSFSDLVAYGNLGNGIVLSSCANITFSSIACNNNGGYGLIGESSGIFSSIVANSNAMGSILQ